jgi:hypothetical protein
MLNLLTPETTLAATKEIVHGIRISTDWPLNMPKVPCFSRAVFQQHIHNKSPRCVNNDVLTFNTQSSTQWDGFRHFGEIRALVWSLRCEGGKCMCADEMGCDRVSRS